MKHVHSKDPRKERIVSKFKRKYGATRVTLLKERDDGSFEAHCLKPEVINDGRFMIKTREYESMGTMVLTKEEAGV